MRKTLGMAQPTFQQTFAEGLTPPLPPPAMPLAPRMIQEQQLPGRNNTPAPMKKMAPEGPPLRQPTAQPAAPLRTGPPPPQLSQPPPPMKIPAEKKDE